ncbi:glycosyltransferase [Pedobacter hartonius]|uniref:Glycosyl transferase family 2 n=1 Tax=Pedobacter hartonius TaxID=425514 RepID=A0A1H4GI58_9SPHI|nr:glycosyltransferase [Pedobacter hartonius]SEB09286.1 Glycosyl transferase family 2 [Pedobacter hartonius]
MIIAENIFNDVTLLITHYNRSSSLERLLRSFKELGIVFGEIIVSDDCSKAVHLDHIRAMREELNFTLISAPVNKGLANNLNKGQHAVKTPYTLYVQEDFIPMDIFTGHFRDAMDIMNEDPAMDIIRFYAYGPYPYLQPYKNGFSLMIYKPWFMDKNKIYNYSDHPHLRRSTFFERFGTYTEGIKSDKTEYEMCLSFIQNKGKGLFYDQYDSLFKQENSSAEPSTVTRSNWRQSSNPILSFVRLLYRQFKYNYDIHINTKFRK